MDYVYGAFFSQIFGKGHSMLSVYIKKKECKQAPQKTVIWV